MKNLNEVTDIECLEIAILEGWESVWESDRGVDIEDEELIQRGRDIIDCEISGNWVNYDRVNKYLHNAGYVELSCT